MTVFVFSSEDGPRLTQAKTAVIWCIGELVLSLLKPELNK